MIFFWCCDVKCYPHAALYMMHTICIQQQTLGRKPAGNPLQLDICWEGSMLPTWIRATCLPEASCCAPNVDNAGGSVAACAMDEQI